MGIKYDPNNISKAWPEDDYHAVLRNVEETISKSSNNEMEVWSIEVFHPSGLTQTIKDYVTAGAAFKIKQLAIALDKKADFEAGRFHAEDHVGASFTASLKIEEDPEYGDKNRVRTYRAKKDGASPPVSLRERAAAPVGSPMTEGDFKEDDIPF